MKGSTTSSGKPPGSGGIGGGIYKDSTHSSEADSDKWRHDKFE
jgi:hypothetical protein